MHASRSRVSTPPISARGLRSVFATPLVPMLALLVALAVGALVVFKPTSLAAWIGGGGSAISPATANPARPALTADEERYIRALWPIHGDVERSTMRMSLGQIFYATKDLAAPELKTRVEQALQVYK